MVILLDGSSQTARVTIAERAVEEHPEWKHLALEVMEEAVPEGEDADFHLQLIKRCAEELEKSGLHLLLTMPSTATHRDLLAIALKPNCITVHLGNNDDSDYDHVIDASTRSVNDVAELLHELMTSSDDE